MLKIYGIRNCDTVKKTLAYCKQHHIAVDFVDFKKTPPTAEQLQQWAQQIDWSILMNKRGTTYRQLSDADKADMTEDKALALLCAYPSMIKRPLCQRASVCWVGYDEARLGNE